jgi:hypothetical protein
MSTLYCGRLPYQTLAQWRTRLSSHLVVSCLVHGCASLLDQNKRLTKEHQINITRLSLQSCSSQSINAGNLVRTVPPLEQCSRQRWSRCVHNVP